jgi:phosphoribosyl-ATP pyrophosphohydrolase
MAKKKTYTEQLTSLQVTLGFNDNKGVLDNVAVLGFGGEAGEVMEELGTERGEYKVQASMSAFTYAARNLDFHKKQMRDGKEPYVEITITDRDRLISELADHFYYQNAILINLGLTHEDLAMLVFAKVKAKHIANSQYKDKR